MKKFENPEIEIVNLEVEDVITTSTTDPEPSNPGYGGGEF